MDVHGRGLKVLGVIGGGGRGLLSGCSEIANRECLLLAEGVIEFDDAIEAVVVGSSLREVVACGRRSRLGVGRIKKAVQIQAELVGREMIFTEEGCGITDPGVGENGVSECDVCFRYLDFSSDEEKGVILPDRSAERESTLMIADQRLAAADRCNWREGGEELIAVEVEDVAMDMVGAGAEDHVGVGAGVAALVGFTSGLHGKLVDGLDGNQAARDAGDTALVGGDDSQPWIDVVGAVDLEVNAGGSGSVY